MHASLTDTALTNRARNTLRIERTLHTNPAPTRLACDGASALGITLDDLPQRAHRALRLNLAPGSLTLVTGPSGSGKSTLLSDTRRCFAESVWPERAVVVDPSALRPGSRPCLDLLAGRHRHPERASRCALDRLARCGLADARAITARASTLSDGQRERLLLAMAMQRAERFARRSPVLLVVDELGGRVDEACARSVARCLRRWLAETHEQGLNIRAIVSTHRAGAIEQLRPGTHIHLSTLGDATVSEEGRQPPSFDDLYTITEGDRADLLALSPLHYRPGAPATITKVLRCVDRSSGELAGVLSVSLPTLNASWRDLAWPGRYRSADPRTDAHRLSKELRCISRVIVEPSHRSMGVASALIRAYLASPQTPATEAVASMGRVSPIFERAGMVAQPLPVAPRHRRLLDAFEACGIETWRLAQPSTLLPRVESLEPPARSLLRAELSRWANASRATRRLTDAGLPALLPVACRAITARPVAYTHTRPSENP